jgi:hypothetical protein
MTPQMFAQSGGMILLGIAGGIVALFFVVVLVDHLLIRRRMPGRLRKWGKRSGKNPPGGSR